MEVIKSRDREMRYNHMMKKLEAQRKERITNIAGPGKRALPEKLQALSQHGTGAAQRLMNQNQYKPPLAPLPPIQNPPRGPNPPGLDLGI